jgi:hypothetical protein
MPLFDNEKAVPINDGGAVLGPESQKSAAFEEESAHAAAARGHYAVDKCVACSMAMSFVYVLT